jgi:hypothetical protein
MSNQVYPQPGLDTVVTKENAESLNEIISVTDETVNQLKPWNRLDTLNSNIHGFNIKILLLGICFSLVFTRVYYMVLAFCIYLVLCKLAFLGSGNGRFQDLTGWRKRIVHMLSYICRFFLFSLGYYQIQRKFVTEEECYEIRKQFKEPVPEVGTAENEKVAQHNFDSTIVKNHPPFVVVCNHSAMVDPMVVVSELGLMSGVAKSDVAKFPLIGTVAKQLNTVSICSVYFVLTFVAIHREGNITC